MNDRTRQGQDGPAERALRALSQVQHRKRLEALIASSPAAKKVEYDAGAVLYHEGTEATLVYALTRGMVKLYNMLPSGRARIVRLHTVGSMIGLDGLVGESYQHTAMALNDVQATVVPHMLIKHLHEAEPEFYAWLLERWYSHLRFADTWITDFSTGQIKGRVARLISFLSGVEPHTRDGEVELLTCDDMADILGVTPESVSRVLAEFKREDILVRSNENCSDIYRIDFDVLEQLGRDL